MPATLVTAAQRTGFARQRNNAVILAAMLVSEDDGEWDTAELCLLMAARADDVLRAQRPVTPSRSWQKCISPDRQVPRLTHTMHYRAGSEPRPCAACCAAHRRPHRQADRQKKKRSRDTDAAEDGAESLPRDNRRLLAVMERSNGPPQTTQGTCAAAPTLVDLAPSPPGPHHAAPTAASWGGCTATQHGAHHADAVDQPSQVPATQYAMISATSLINNNSRTHELCCRK
eukprot:scaffold8370_cov101-Isochrysis_galbana.AAC.4